LKDAVGKILLPCLIGAQWLLGGLRSGDASWFAVHIGQARDVMPVGSGWDISQRVFG
jgi:hypothetical protein